MVTGLLRIGRKALEEWFATNYAELNRRERTTGTQYSRVESLIPNL